MSENHTEALVKLWQEVKTIEMYAWKLEYSGRKVFILNHVNAMKKELQAILGPME